MNHLLRRQRLEMASLALLCLGCCSGPGFVVGYIGGLLLGSTSLGALLYAGQLAANLLAAGLCLPMLPKADAHGAREVPC